MSLKKKNKCICCGQKETVASKRAFSKQSWTMLLHWGEVQTPPEDGALTCEKCYWELREVLIDRADEIQETYGSILEEQKDKVAV